MRSTLTHIAFHSEDIEGMVDFYSKYCGLRICHKRVGESGSQVIWMAEPGRESEFIYVFISKGPDARSLENDYSHLGFAMESRQDVDLMAERARKDGCLAWEPRQEPYPVGYYCALRDPQGNFVEFSYGQPLGPGAEDTPRSNKE